MQEPDVLVVSVSTGPGVTEKCGPTQGGFGLV